MRAVVLVGGFGTRLRPLTYTVPKPMLPIVHRPMIVRLVDRLAAAGVSEVVLALGFQPDPFYDAFPGGRHGDVAIRYITEPEPLDTAGAIAFAASSVGIDDTFVVANGDIISDFSIEGLIAAHRRFGVAATLHLISVTDPSAYGAVEVDSVGRVERFVEKPQPGESASNLINAGTYVMEPEVLDIIAPGERVSVERDTFPMLIEQRQLAAIALDGYWTDAGKPNTYRLANLEMLDVVSELAVHPGAVVDPTACVVNSIVGPGAVIGKRAEVRDCVVLPGGVVGIDAYCDASIVAGTVDPGQRITETVIGADR